MGFLSIWRNSRAHPVQRDGARGPAKSLQEVTPDWSLHPNLRQTILGSAREYKGAMAGLWLGCIPTWSSEGTHIAQLSHRDVWHETFVAVLSSETGDEMISRDVWNLF